MKFIFTKSDTDCNKMKEGVYRKKNCLGVNKNEGKKIKWKKEEKIESMKRKKQGIKNDLNLHINWWKHIQKRKKTENR